MSYYAGLECARIPSAHDGAYVLDNATNRWAGVVSAIVVPCSARKKKLQGAYLSASNLPVGTQRTTARKWLDRLSRTSCHEKAQAQDLYVGAAFLRARKIAAEAGCPLFVLSAGLGLLAGTTRVPAYDLTLSPSAAMPLQAQITEAFDPSKWWTAIQQGAFARPMTDLAKGRGRILIALTQPYASLVGHALAGLPAAVRRRLRLLGAGLAPCLPGVLHECIIAYDSRLDVLIPGTRLDTAARSLEHFARLAAAVSVTNVKDDQRLVDAALEATPARTITKRPRMDDAALLDQIAPLARRGLSATKALRHLRDELQVACEMRRFHRLYEEIKA